MPHQHAALGGKNISILFNMPEYKSEFAKFYVSLDLQQITSEMRQLTATVLTTKTE